MLVIRRIIYYYSYSVINVSSLTSHVFFRVHRMEDEIDAEAGEHDDGQDVVHRRTDIVGHEGGFHPGVFEDRAEDTHDGTAGEQTGG